MSKMAADYNAINLSQGFPNFPIDPILEEIVQKKATETVGLDQKLLDTKVSTEIQKWKATVEDRLAQLKVEETTITTAVDAWAKGQGLTIEARKVYAEQQKIYSELNLKATELATANSVGQLIDTVQVYAQLCNALFSASDVSLNSGTNFGVSGPFKYNPDAGEVLWDPIV
jgi:hypothetical protein